MSFRRRKCSSVVEPYRPVVQRNGKFQVTLHDIGATLWQKYYSDAFTTLMDAKWRWTLLIFFMGFMVTWLGFTGVYYAFGYANGDITGVDHSDDWSPCMAHVYSFTTALLFSVESQHTIGYGYRNITPHCPHAITAVFFQFIVGIGVQCLTAGIVFAKLQRAKKRAETVMFSHTACVGLIDGHWSLMVRVGNFRQSQLLSVSGTGILIKKTKMPDSKEEIVEEHLLDFKSEGGSDWMTLLWPAVMYHTITPDSPLWPTENLLSNFGGFSELIVLLEGVVESTSRSLQARTSYLATEIPVGCRFKHMDPQLRDDGKFHFSYFDFHGVVPTFQSRPQKPVHNSRRVSTSTPVNVHVTIESTPLRLEAPRSPKILELPSSGQEETTLTSHYLEPLAIEEAPPSPAMIHAKVEISSGETTLTDNGYTSASTSSPRAASDEPINSTSDDTRLKPDQNANATYSNQENGTKAISKVEFLDNFPPIKREQFLDNLEMLEAITNELQE